MPGKRAKENASDPGWQEIVHGGEIAGHPVVYIPETDSTNDRCMVMGLAGAPTGTVVLAERQTAGKGRLGKSWISPAGHGLYFSLLLRPSLQLQDLPKITLAVGVALCRAIVRLYSLSPMMKWPNDILVDGKKCGGILVEADLRHVSSPVIIVGIGMNATTPLSDFPKNLRQRATSLQCHMERAVIRSELLKSILREIDRIVIESERRGFGAILQEWRRHDATLGKKLVWLTADHRTIEGISLGPDDAGRLHIKDSQGRIHEVLSGDISLTPE